jgi:multidrug efflux pump subunit AcrA (membrane-fusion protein)
MRVSACPYPDYGTLRGKVQQISEDTLKPQGNSTTATKPDSANAKNGALIYEVTIVPERSVLTQGKKQCSIKFGMEGTVDIISREETVLQFFLRRARLIADL